MENLLERLLDIGLSDAEAASYLYLLGVHAASVQEVTDAVKFPRSTVNLALQDLEKIGIVRSMQKGKRVVYYVEDTEDLRRLVEHQELKAREKRVKVDILSPLLKEHHVLGKDEKIETHIFKGVAGADKFYRLAQHLPNDAIIYRIIIGETDFQLPYELESIETFFKKKKEKNISSRVLSVNNKLGKLLAADDLLDNRETRFLPLDTLMQHIDTGSLTIFDDYVAFMRWDISLTTLLIKSQGFARLQRGIFNYLWNQGKKS